MAFSRKTWALTLTCAALIGLGARYAADYEPDDLTTEWKALLDVCRTAIEEAKPLDIRDLQPLELSRRDREELVGQRKRWRAFAKSGGSFALLETEFGPPERVTRSCKIVRRPGLRPLSERQEALLHYAFTREKNNLIQAGTHGIGKEIVIYPFVMQSFSALKPNLSGCSTVAVIRTTPRDRMPEFPPDFSTEIGEQTFLPCGAPSRLDADVRQKL